MSLDDAHRLGVRLSRSAPTRRTLVRGTAWAVPVVSVAAAAPAMAAISHRTSTLTVSGQFWIHSWGDGTYGVAPTITVTNPSAALTDEVVVSLRFPYPDFQGDDSGVPAQPGIVNQPFASSKSWVIDLPPPAAGATEAVVNFTCAAGLGGHETVTIGAGQLSANPSTITWVNNPTASSVAMTANALGPGFEISAGTLQRVAHP